MTNQEELSGQSLNTRSISDSIGKVFLDTDGSVWRLLFQNGSKFLGLYKPKKLEFIRDQSSLAESVAESVQRATIEMLDSWNTTIAKPEIDKLADLISPLVDTCINAGEKKFRKELLDALGTQGEKMFSSFANDKFEEIGRAYEQDRRQERVFQTDGPFPVNTRFRWQLITPKYTYTAFCLDVPPQRRTIDMCGVKRRLVFPWVRFIVYFVNGELYEDVPSGDNDHGHCGLGVFYGSKKLQSQNEALYFCNLPEVNYQLPFGTCLGSGRPPIKLSDPNWNLTLLDWFWGSGFYDGQPWSTELWRQAASTIPEVSNIEEWEKFSMREDSLLAVCKLPWIQCDYNLGQMVKAVLDYIAQKYEKSQESLAQKRDGQLKLLASQFREQLEEKILFLGAHFSVPQNMVQGAKDFLSVQITNLVVKLTTSLRRRSKKMGKDFGEHFVEELQQKGE
ncbi:MAG: hypothetical protein A2915_01395 [Candidatus Yanofskybacteria bacterium RIFCSPLOWO2_01_FULL_41_34]|uniref:Uncharacterized protein n=1 Tax=Candidatus Yanofskybacteria bacterium RIFCSPHIGHO2_01_FULL_41_26 TaxID=1802661 RepID=A0A1F8EBE9_9BACT|nr:MAG: hypothetical protein A2649_01870 [Candidatus Yanofskybacteria bacterium RIFCSPHIGHO2_01_FULL_41_26]OGN21886.1 MAG: hypothetical protein A2915_01395 [Candidatus Yanofskybacteria bacterium RIFCSPLOWO2_01_FULL_41_34]